MYLYFFTEKLDKKLYKRAIETFLYETLKKIDTRWLSIVNNLTINIYPSTWASSDPNFHGINGVGGVTGINIIKMYLQDKPSVRSDSFQQALRSNMVALTHELCHHILISLGKTHKVPLRHADFSGHKAGTMLNYSTAEVHDRHTEGDFFNLTFWHYYKGILPWKLTIQVLDIRDLV